MVKNVQPKAAETPTGSTPKVGRQKVLLAWSKTRSDYTQDETTGKWTKAATDKVETGNHELFLPTKVMDWFSIPESTAVKPVDTTPAYVDVKPTNYVTFGDLDDTTGTTRTRRGYKRLKQGKRGGKRKRSVFVPVGGGRVTGKGRPRMVSIPFPLYFDVNMIAQALGQILGSVTQPERKPIFFYMGDSGASYPIPYNTADAPFTGAESGAWVAASYTAPTNEQGGDSIGGGATLSSSGDRTP